MLPLGIKYVIWKQRINSGSGWRAMANRGGITANHFDHVHITFLSSTTGGGSGGPTRGRTAARPRPRRSREVDVDGLYDDDVIIDGLTAEEEEYFFPEEHTHNHEHNHNHNHPLKRKIDVNVYVN